MRTLFIFFLCLICALSFGQQQTYSLVPLSLQDLTAFTNPSKNWEIAGGASGNFASNKVKTTKGTGILFNNFTEAFRYKPEANLFTRMEHGDMILSLDFMMPKGSNSGIYFQGRYEIQLFDNWGIATPGITDCGSIYERWNESLPEGKKGYDGHPARSNASFAPGLWQHLDIEFQAPKFDSNGKKIQPARFAKVILNGMVVQENVVLSGPTRAAAFTDEKPTGPLMLQGDHGQVLFRNIQYALLNEFKTTISDLQYEYYEGSFENFEQATPDKLTRKGNTELSDSRLADNPNKLCLIFTGKIAVPEDNTYQFTLRKHGTARLEVDDKEIIKRNDEFGDVAVSVNLSAGVHTFKLGYIKNFSWASTGVGLFLSKANARPVALHVPTSVPKVSVTPLITVKATSAPELVRSFADFNEKKKTHVISVGDASGTHYMYNLGQAALMKTWRGDFLNVTDMWHERGEPQTATPMGAAIAQSGRCPLALVTNEKNALPDTLNSETDLIYKSLTLDAKGYPTFNYHYKSLVMEDALKPNSAVNGLTRTLTLKNLSSTEILIVRMGEGISIEEVTENTFALDNRYYIQYIPQGKTKPAIRQSGNKKELVLEYNSKIGSSISYSIIW
jgi:Domain of Unknown Function (DUF1080)/PA14 domain